MIKNMPGAIINLPKEMEFSKQRPTIEVIIKKDNKVIYHNKTYAVVMNMVQSKTVAIEENGDVSLEGDSQVFGVGNAVIQMFAMNELTRKLYAAGIPAQANIELVETVKDPQIRAAMQAAIRRMVEGK